MVILRQIILASTFSVPTRVVVGPEEFHNVRTVEAPRHVEKGVRVDHRHPEAAVLVEVVLEIQLAGETDGYTGNLS